VVAAAGAGVGTGATEPIPFHDLQVAIIAFERSVLRAISF
jgi:hypothetical protein